MLQRTPLYPSHLSLGARMGPFAGWEMPIHYRSILEEHMATRTRAGLFDVSHMGRIFIRGDAALELIQRLTTNDASRLANGQAQYSALCYPEGTFLDDILVYRFSEREFMICTNAINRERDLAWIRNHSDRGVSLEDESEHLAQLALQGPRAKEILASVAPSDLGQIKYYRFQRSQVDGVPAAISRSGYTGEDGFELYFPAAEAKRLWERILEAGRRWDLLPAGLGARNTLRLEAGMCLYGQELDDRHTPIEADLAFIVKPDKGDYIGREAHLQQLQRGVKVKLVGLEMTSRGVPREHYPIYYKEERIGEVTSGGFAPYLKKNIALAYVEAALATLGREVEVAVRASRIAARVVARPFYQRKRD